MAVVAVLIYKVCVCGGGGGGGGHGLSVPIFMAEKAK